MFKMEVWETLLTSMRVGEVAEFWCDAVVSDCTQADRNSSVLKRVLISVDAPQYGKHQSAVASQRYCLSRDSPSETEKCTFRF